MGKVDRDLVNCTVPYVVSRTPSSQGGVVEIWSDGYCVQSGYDAGNTVTIRLDKTYKYSDYLIFLSRLSGSTTTVSKDYWARTVTQNTFEIYKQDNLGIYWRTEGYIR